MTKITKRVLNENLENSFKGIWIPKDIWLCDELTPIQMLVLMQIHSLDGKFGCKASNEHIAEFFGVHKDTISEHIQNLKKKNFIIIGYKDNNPSLGERIIKCSRKFKLITAGLIDEIEEYKNTLGENTEGVGKTPRGLGENTDERITLEPYNNKEGENSKIQEIENYQLDEVRISNYSRRGFTQDLLEIEVLNWKSYHITEINNGKSGPIDLNSSINTWLTNSLTNLTKELKARKQQEIDNQLLEEAKAKRLEAISKIGEKKENKTEYQKSYQEEKAEEINRKHRNQPVIPQETKEELEEKEREEARIEEELKLKESKFESILQNKEKAEELALEFVKDEMNQSLRSSLRSYKNEDNTWLEVLLSKMTAKVLFKNFILKNC